MLGACSSCLLLVWCGAAPYGLPFCGQLANENNLRTWCYCCCCCCCVPSVRIYCCAQQHLEPFLSPC
uniref:Putative secreted protein n=1 Tax=Anopheles darlingi TaxID=43151 RepID=A0A2M4D702_ANODA